jgi:hypothetical protein
MLTAQILREELSYDPDTGVFTRKDTGRVAGDQMKSGYWRISVKGRRYSAHRLAWLYMMDKWPNHHVDHIDGDKINNRFNNLRDVSRAQNLHNVGQPNCNNTSGFRGVSLHQGKWRAQIMLNRKHIKIGCFDTPEEAHAAYLSYKSLINQ